MINVKLQHWHKRIKKIEDIPNQVHFKLTLVFPYQGSLIHKDAIVLKGGDGLHFCADETGARIDLKNYIGWIAFGDSTP